MKKLYSVAQQIKDYNFITLEEKWTLSKGRDTYGYNICSLWSHYGKVASCNGGGYDMQGTSLAEFLMIYFADRFPMLEGCGLYGWSGSYINGGCGLSCVERIAKEMGIYVRTEYTGRNRQNKFYTLTVYENKEALIKDREGK